MESNAISSEARLREISSTLVRERKKAGSLSQFPGTLPANLEEAYKVQAISRDEWPDRIIGWKVGGVPPAHRDALSAEFLSGPIFARRLYWAKPGEAVEMPVFEQGFAAIEPEFVLMIGAIPAQDRVFVGVEIASSPLRDINGIGPLAVVCDFGNNNGLLLGPEVVGWREMKGVRVPVSTEIDGEVVGQKVVLDLPEAVMRARNFLLSLAERQDIPLPEGTLVSTGAITGVHDSVCGARSKLIFGQWGTLELELVAERPFA